MINPKVVLRSKEVLGLFKLPPPPAFIGRGWLNNWLLFTHRNRDLVLLKVAKVRNPFNNLICKTILQ